MADKLYWIGKNATQVDTEIIAPGDLLPVGKDGKIAVDKKTLSEWQEKGLVSEYPSAKAKADANKIDFEKEYKALKKEIAELRKDGDKKLVKENKVLKAENEELKKQIEELNSPILGD